MHNYLRLGSLWLAVYVWASVPIIASAQTLVASQEPTTFFLMRHAEKKMDVSDAELNDLGKARAELLVEQLSLVRIDGFYTTPYIRTRSTLMPLATNRGQTLQEYLPKNGNALLDSLKRQAGKTYVISGHSNTIPDLVNHLVNDPNKYTALQDDEYDRLFMVIVWPDGRTKDIVLRLVAR